MGLKQYVRKGIIDESTGYKTVLRFDELPPDRVLLLLEGKCRRKVRLNARRTLYENYYPEALVGLEDLLLGRARPGATGVYPGAHYILWDARDLLGALEIYPELARRAIFELSRRIRIYDAHEHTTDIQLRQDPGMDSMDDLANPDSELVDALYEMSFAAEDEFPPHLISRLARTFQPGDHLLKQGELTFDLYILLEGHVDVFISEQGERRKVDSLGAGEMVGEMAQFDGVPRSADVVATAPVQELAFAPENFQM
ncbi:MAG: cyclic nucleotide-binding domain-containing protein, partial [Leptospiraceae bacterium]|nr:cyclic nucleotide-binding domain-containing protein [Leptospiraceae bacterium]